MRQSSNPHWAQSPRVQSTMSPSPCFSQVSACPKARENIEKRPCGCRQCQISTLVWIQNTPKSFLNSAKSIKIFCQDLSECFMQTWRRTFLHSVPTWVQVSMQTLLHLHNAPSQPKQNRVHFCGLGTRPILNIKKHTSFGLFLHSSQLE